MVTLCLSREAASPGCVMGTWRWKGFGKVSGDPSERGTNLLQGVSSCSSKKGAGLFFAAGKVRAGEAGSFSRVGTFAWVSRDGRSFFPLFFSFSSLQQIIYESEENTLTSLITSVLVKD